MADENLDSEIDTIDDTDNLDEEAQVIEGDDELDLSDPDEVQAKIEKLEKDNKTMTKRYRDLQSYSDKRVNKARDIESALEKHGLTMSEDGAVVKKQHDVSETSLDKEKILEMSKKDPIAAIEKLVSQGISKAMAAKETKSAQAILDSKQLADKDLVLSLPGGEEAVKELLTIIREKGLEKSYEPFTQALLTLGDATLLESMQEKKNVGRRSREAQKRAATVARGGRGHTSGSSVEGVAYEKLMDMPMEKIEKLAEAESRRQRG